MKGLISKVAVTVQAEVIGPVLYVKVVTAVDVLVKTVPLHPETEARW